MTKRELLDALWPDVFVADGALKVCIREIRRALDDDAPAPRFIETAHRRGYRFIAPVTELTAACGAAGRRAAPSRAARRRSATREAATSTSRTRCSAAARSIWCSSWAGSRISNTSGATRRSRASCGGWPSFARLILFDKRGTGLSDPVTEMPTLEQRMDDVRAVMDAVGSQRAVLLGVSEGGPMCSLFAATYPERTEALVMIGTYARRTRTDDYPWAPTPEQREAFCREILEQWGGPVGIEERAPSKAGDPAFRDWWSSYLRMGASPAAAVALTRMNAQIDIRHILPTVRVPTLVVHRTGDRCLRVEEGRYVASLIPDAVFASCRATIICHSSAIRTRCCARSSSS